MALDPSTLDWRSSKLWHRIGYAATAIWMIGVLAVTDSDPNHPLFRYIFIVPLGGWLLGILIARFVTPPPDRPD